MEDFPESDDLDIGQFRIPESFLNKLHEFSGPCEGSRGFILATVSQSGRPVILSKYDNQVVDMGIRKALEIYLEDTIGDETILPEE